MYGGGPARPAAGDCYQSQRLGRVLDQGPLLLKHIAGAAEKGRVTLHYYTLHFLFVSRFCGKIMVDVPN